MHSAPPSGGTNPILDAALALHDAGCAVVPVATDGTKRPAGNWKHYQSQRADRETVAAWFEHGHSGLGVITGAVSGNLEMIEFEGRAIADGVDNAFMDLGTSAGIHDLWNRLITGYVERTPSGGIHILYRVTGAPAAPNTKLASRPARPEELTEHEQAQSVRHPGRAFPRVLLETRGEGGFVVTAPSHGSVHPSGQRWELLTGGAAAIPTITAEERDALHDIARALDTMPKPEPEAMPTASAGFRAGMRPGDDFNARTSWADILRPHGWTPVPGGEAGEQLWRRPGKNLGVSASTDYQGTDGLFVWTTSTQFVAEKPYSKFAAYTLLEHGGNFTEAAKALAARGFGDPPKVSKPAQAASTEQAPPGAAPTVSGSYTVTDDGNALRLIDTFGQRIRYVPERGKWLTWDRYRWRFDDAGTVREYAKTIGRTLPELPELAKHQAYTLSARGTSNMLTQASTDPRITVSAAALDAEARALNTPAGSVDLTTGVLTAPDPVRLHTRATAVAPDTAIATPLWDQFLKQATGGDQSLAEYLQRLAGYSASGDVGTHVLPFLHGPGGNGKSVFADVLRHLLGDYATVAPPGFLMAGAQGHPTEIAMLQGQRLVIANEIDPAARFDEAKMKTLTGGDTLSARYMRQDYFAFTPTHHLWLIGNHQPTVKAGGTGFWRRVRLVPFTHTVPAHEVIDNLAGRLIAEEGPGILAWIINGAVAYFRDGLTEPASVTAATDSYAAEEDHLGRFLDEACLLGGGDAVRLDTTVLRGAYEQWCFEERETVLSARTFGRELKARGITSAKSNGRRLYVGIALTTSQSVAA